MDHKGCVLSGHVAPFNETVVRNVCTIVTAFIPIFDRVFVVCSESRGQRALWIIAPVWVWSNVDIYLGGVILVKVSCRDHAKVIIKYILTEED